jgi:hypothetical protein
VRGHPTSGYLTECIYDLDLESQPPRTKSSTNGLVLLIQMSSGRCLGGVDFLKLRNKYIVSNED